MAVGIYIMYYHSYRTSATLGTYDILFQNVSFGGPMTLLLIQYTHPK